MKNFVNENKQLFKYEIENQRISLGYPKTTYTSENYYSSFVETFLNKNIETPIPKLVKFVAKLFDTHLNFSIDEQYIDIAFSYISSLIARNPQQCKNISNNSIYFQFLDEQKQHDTTVLITLNSSSIYKALNNFYVSFMINKTDIPFILPTRGVYELTINKVICGIAPISSQCAIMLIEKGKNFHSKNSSIKELIIVENENRCMIDNCNKFAFIKQMRDNTGYIISNDKKQLTDIFNTCK